MDCSASLVFTFGLDFQKVLIAPESNHKGGVFPLFLSVWKNIFANSCMESNLFIRFDHSNEPKNTKP